ncbi:hypothetical protein ACFQZ4_42910 [Catellatospora coxensis]
MTSHCGAWVKLLANVRGARVIGLAAGPSARSGCESVSGRPTQRHLSTAQGRAAHDPAGYQPHSVI